MVVRHFAAWPSQVISVLGGLPVGDGALQLVNRVARVGGKRRDEVVAEHSGEILIGFERVETVPQAHGEQGPNLLQELTVRWRKRSAPITIKSGTDNLTAPTA
jgi:hypothetical protein